MWSFILNVLPISQKVFSCFSPDFSYLWIIKYLGGFGCDKLPVVWMCACIYALLWICIPSKVCLLHAPSFLGSGNTTILTRMKWLLNEWMNVYCLSSEWVLTCLMLDSFNYLKLIVLFIYLFYLTQCFIFLPFMVNRVLSCEKAVSIFVFCFFLLIIDRCSCSE